MSSRHAHCRQSSTAVPLHSLRPTLNDAAPNALPGKGVRFVKRIYRLRLIGLSIGFFCVAAAFLQHPVDRFLWVLLVLHGYIWPHIAYLMARKNCVPYRAEHRNLIIDSLFGGFWIIAMQGNLVPCAVILAMLSMDNIAAGGSKLFIRGLLGSLSGTLLGLLLLDFQLQPASDLNTILACLPMIVLYPLVLGKSTYDMSQKLAERSRQFEIVSQQDGLTGLFNRRHWETLLVDELKNCRAQKYMSCLLLLDIDHFKHVNDTYGHLVGDDVLKNFSALLQRHLRPGDLIGRYGGEEFVAILHDIELGAAVKLAQELVEQVRACRAHGLWGCTISAGLAPYQPQTQTHYTWLQRADHAMYRAKNGGRDCLVVDD